MNNLIWKSDSMVTSTPGLIPCSAIESLSSAELFHNMCLLGFAAFLFPLYMFCPVMSSAGVPTLY